MARKNEPTIINVFNWLSNVIDTQELKLSDIGLLTQIIKNLNRNFWKPLKMSIYKIAKNSGSDDRTIRDALKRLAMKNVIIAKNADTFGQIDDPAKFFASKKFSRTDNDNYFSIIQKDGEFFIGIENRKITSAKVDEPERKLPAQNAQHGDDGNDRPSNVKTLDSLLKQQSRA